MGLNAQQQSAVDCNDKNILCLAGAGTGKTYTMIQRISKIVNSGVSGNSILVLTFTNAAAAEMKSRYKSLGIKGFCPEFRTFHSFCYHLIASDKSVRTKLGYRSVPSIIDQYKFKQIKTATRLSYNIKLSEKQLSDRSKLNMAQSYEAALYDKALNKSLKSQNLTTFDLICYEVCKLFVDKDQCISKYLERYKYIFVDEFQDTDPKQYDFITSFKDANLFVVGDALQAIYSFRGADSTIIQKLSNDDKWTTIKLYQNYRSTSNICNYANSNSVYADNSYRIAIQSDKLGVDVVEFDEHISNSFDAIIDVKSFKDNILSRFKKLEGSIAILSRTNKEAQALICELKDNGIQTNQSDGNDLTLNILKSCLDDTYQIDWLSSTLDVDKYAEYIKLMSLSDDNSVENSRHIILQLSKYPNKLKYIFKDIDDIKLVLNSESESTNKITSIVNILNLDKDIIVSLQDNSPESIINYIINALESQEPSELYVGTIHSSKGLEYDNVFLVGVDSKWFKLGNEDNNNLFYVGITRAKNNLFVGVND